MYALTAARFVRGRKEGIGMMMTAGAALIRLWLLGKVYEGFEKWMLMEDVSDSFLLRV